MLEQIRPIKIRSKKEIIARFNDVYECIGRDMAPPVVNALRVSELADLNWVLGCPCDPHVLDKWMLNYAGITSTPIPDEEKT